MSTTAIEGTPNYFAKGMELAHEEAKERRNLELSRRKRIRELIEDVMQRHDEPKFIHDVVVEVIQQAADLGESRLRPPQVQGLILELGEEGILELDSQGAPYVRRPEPTENTK